MSERTLRGSRLGAASYEDDRDISPAPRRSVAYDCVSGHQFELQFAADAEIPEVWECPRCGGEAIRNDGDRPEPKSLKPPRTHWDMLLERRSVDELEQLLAERLEMLRSGKIGPGHIATSESADDEAASKGKSKQKQKTQAP